jgi:clan AA aspartic protease
MIRGYVSNDVALIPLVVHGTQGNSLAIEAMIDTGFNDCLILSRDLTDALSLRLVEQGDYVLADGSSIPARFFAADVIWMGVRRESAHS